MVPLQVFPPCWLYTLVFRDVHLWSCDMLNMLLHLTSYLLWKNIIHYNILNLPSIYGFQNTQTVKSLYFLFYLNCCQLSFNLSLVCPATWVKNHRCFCFYLNTVKLSVTTEDILSSTLCCIVESVTMFFLPACSVLVVKLWLDIVCIWARLGLFPFYL